MILPKTTQPPYEADTSSLTEEQRDNIQSSRYISELDAYEVEIRENYEMKIAKLERKIERLTSENTLSLPEEPEIQYENGITVYAGDVVVENGERYEVQLPSFTTKEAWRPSILYAQGNRTLWKKEPADIPEENLCAETPDWNSANWNDYIVGYHVKHDSAIWKAINTTHTWIAPAHSGDGAISWEHVKDCS